MEVLAILKPFLKYAHIFFPIWVFLGIAGPLNVEGKTFFTVPFFENKAYLKADATYPLKFLEDCRMKCDIAPKCFAFSFSKFEEECRLYEYTPGMKVLQSLSYKLFVSERSEDDGYFKFGTSYVKIYFERRSAEDAQAFCRSQMDGMLVAIKSEELNNLVGDIMSYHKLYEAHIGLTDAKHEGTWLYYDGTPVEEYSNWNFKGYWKRRDLNCAVIRADREWRQVNCYDVRPFVCQIPFY